MSSPTNLSRITHQPGEFSVFGGKCPLTKWVTLGRWLNLSLMRWKQFLSSDTLHWRSDVVYEGRRLSAHFLSDRFSILFVVEWILRGSKSEDVFFRSFSRSIWFSCHSRFAYFLLSFCFFKRKRPINEKKKKKKESPHCGHGLYKIVDCNLWRHLISWWYLHDVNICHPTKTYRNTFKRKK